MGIFELYLKNLKGGPMISWSGAAAIAFYQWGIAQGLSGRPLYYACAAIFLASCLLYAINPKTLQWLPSGARIIDTFAPEPEDPRYVVEIPRSPVAATSPLATAAPTAEEIAEAVAFLRNRAGGR